MSYSFVMQNVSSDEFHTKECAMQPHEFLIHATSPNHIVVHESKFSLRRRRTYQMQQQLGPRHEQGELCVSVCVCLSHVQPALDTRGAAVDGRNVWFCLYAKSGACSWAGLCVQAFTLSLHHQHHRLRAVSSSARDSILDLLTHSLHVSSLHLGLVPSS